VEYVKKRFLKYFKIIFYIFIFSFLLVGGGYLYLNSLVDDITISNKAESVPFNSVTPQTTDILFEVEGDYFLLLLNFNDLSLRAKLSVNDSFTATQLSDYASDYKVLCDYKIVEYFVDNVGGLEIDTGDEVLRFTGIQTIDLLRNENTSCEDVENIISQLFSKLGECGFWDDYLRYIISNTECNIDYTKAFRWCDYLSKMCLDFEFLEY